jgi:hypothetical protein
MITKIDAAERQLNTAIRLFFENHDHLSSYTLAIASREIADDILAKQSDEIFRKELERLGDATKVRMPYRERMHDHIKPEYHKQARELFNKRQNFLKHANKDPDGEMDDVSSKELAFVILFAASNFHLLTDRLTREMMTFLCWFGVAEPHLVRLDDGKLSKAILEFKQTCPGDPYDSIVLEAVHRSLYNLE